jgi:hypothetical protein
VNNLILASKPKKGRKKVYKMDKNFKNVTIRKSTHDMARFLSKLTDRSMASIISELVENVFNIAMNYSQANLEFESCMNDATVQINVVGRSKLVVGEKKAPKEILEKESNSPILTKVKVGKKYVDLKKVN